ncbi:hypothetical protein HanIR_Chr03g0104771 [Helianthus annuus]|nr:hypothetical protein HanIR_Chr03g0104771 [Helianthus annuus]
MQNMKTLGLEMKNQFKKKKKKKKKNPMPMGHNTMKHQEVANLY